MTTVVCNLSREVGAAMKASVAVTSLCVLESHTRLVSMDTEPISGWRFVDHRGYHDLLHSDEFDIAMVEFWKSRRDA